MWDLNGSPDEATRAITTTTTTTKGYHESEGCSSQKTTSFEGDDKNSTSSAVVNNDGGERSDGDDRKNTTTNNGRIFGFTFSTNTSNNYINPNDDDDEDEDNSSFSGEPPVTRQFFPVETDVSGGDVAGTSSVAGDNFPQAHWGGSRSYPSDTMAAGATLMGPAGNSKPMELAQPMKKSRRGPRSRSSQYRGVTYYRRTGRWESHIWLFILQFSL